MRLLIIGSLGGQVGAATKLAMGSQSSNAGLGATSGGVA